MYSINWCFLSLPATGVDVTMRLVDGSKKFCHSCVGGPVHFPRGCFRIFPDKVYATLSAHFHKLHCVIVSTSCLGQQRSEYRLVRRLALKASSMILFPRPSVMSESVVTCK